MCFFWVAWPLPGKLARVGGHRRQPVLNPAMHKASDAGHIGPHGMRRCLSFSYKGTCEVPPTPIVNHQKMTLRTRLELEKLKFKMWKGGGGHHPPSLFWEASEAKNGPKRAFFLEKSLRRNAVNISVFAFCGLLPWKM